MSDKTCCIGESQYLEQRSNGKGSHVQFTIIFLSQKSKQMAFQHKPTVIIPSNEKSLQPDMEVKAKVGLEDAMLRCRGNMGKYDRQN